MALYADDTTIAYKSRQFALVMNRLPVHGNKIADWFIKWRNAISGDKSGALLIKGRRRYFPEQYIIIDGQRIPWKKLTSKKHRKEVSRKTIAARIKLFAFIGRKSGLKLHILPPQSGSIIGQKWKNKYLNISILSH